MKFFYAALVLCAFSLAANGQVKIEKESKVMSNEVPMSAVSWLAEVFDEKNKLKWYFETSAKSQSYEAKFYHKRRKYSVKFNLDGTLEDIEVLVQWRDLPLSVRQNISEYFRAHFLKSKVKKIQIQYTGEEENIKNWIGSNNLDGLNIKHEVEFYGKTSEAKKIWEGLFDNEGNILMKREIILAPSNNLFF